MFEAQRGSYSNAKHDLGYLQQPFDPSRLYTHAQATSEVLVAIGKISAININPSLRICDNYITLYWLGKTEHKVIKNRFRYMWRVRGECNFLYLRKRVIYVRENKLALITMVIYGGGKEHQESRDKVIWIKSRVSKPFQIDNLIPQNPNATSTRSFPQHARNNQIGFTITQSYHFKRAVAYNIPGKFIHCREKWGDI